MKTPTVEFLRKRRAIILADLLAKAEAEDWHGVQDCGSDLREIDAQLSILHLQSSVRLVQAEGDH